MAWTARRPALARLRHDDDLIWAVGLMGLQDALDGWRDLPEVGLCLLWAGRALCALQLQGRLHEGAVRMPQE